MHRTEREQVCGILLPSLLLQMMTAAEVTGRCVSLSELVIEVTTSWCCRWVSAQNTH